MATQRSKKGSEKVLGSVLRKGSQKGSEKGACYGFAVIEGSEKSSQKGFLGVHPKTARRESFRDKSRGHPGVIRADVQGRVGQVLNSLEKQAFACGHP